MTVEEGAVCGGSLERLRELYDMGVRMLTLTWNYRNELGWPATRRCLGRAGRRRWETNGEICSGENTGNREEQLCGGKSDNGDRDGER